MLSLDNLGMPFTSVVAASVKTMLLIDNGGLPFMSMVAAPCPVLSWIKSHHLVWLLLGPWKVPPGFCAAVHFAEKII